MRKSKAESFFFPPLSGNELEEYIICMGKKKM